MKAIKPSRITRVEQMIDGHNILILKLGRRDMAYGRIILKCILHDIPDCVIWAR
jgi:hypothetical protein